MSKLVVLAVSGVMLLAWEFPGSSAERSLSSPSATTPPPGSSGSTQRSDTVVREGGRPLHPGGGTLVPEITIGALDGPPHYTFGTVVDVTVGRGGVIYAADQRAYAVYQYDASGKYLRNIGRRGQGPGEFSFLGSIETLPDGRLALYDGSRVNIYSAAGDVVATWNAPANGGTLWTDTAGYLYVGRTAALPGPLSAVAPKPSVVRLRPDGSVVDSVSLPTYPAPPVTESGTYTTNLPSGATSGRRMAAVPLWPEGMSTMSPLGYLVGGYPAKYAIELLIPRSRTRPWTPGDPVISIRRSDAAAAVASDSERTALRTGRETAYRQVDPGYKWNAPDIPRTKPFYQDLKIGLDGRIWAKMYDRYEYDVFQPDGRYLGHVTAPTRGTLHVMHGDTVWATARDTNDVQIIRRYHVAWK